MNSSYKAKRDEGFTIIEVLIVLAIAGLIILIVFLALPALQRNSRNTQYKEQVSNYVAAVTEFINNNNGNPPTSTNVGTINGLSADGPITEPSTTIDGSSTAQSSVVAIGQMQLVTSSKCSTTTIGNSDPSSNRSFAIRYSVENSSGGAVPQCAGS